MEKGLLPDKEKELTITKEIELESAIDDYTIAKKLVQLKQSADSRGIEFTLSFRKVKNLMNSKVCYYTGKKFSKKGINAKSIDRVDSTKGYTDSNVVACTTDINRKKSNLTIEEIRMISKKTETHLNSKQDKNIHPKRKEK